jgi:SAM-dependent methyltransferase
MNTDGQDSGDVTTGAGSAAPEVVPDLERLTWSMRIGAVQEHLTRYVWALKWCAEKRVLDVGCANGYGTWLLAHVAEIAVGIDCCAEAIQEAYRYRDGNARFRECRLEDLSVQYPFDTVVCLEVLEHLDDMEAGLAKLLELTAPEGTLLLSLPVLNGENPYHHGRDYTLAQWDKFMEDRGFDLLRFFQPFAGDEADVSNCRIVERGEGAEEVPGDLTGSALYAIRRSL